MDTVSIGPVAGGDAGSHSRHRSVGVADRAADAMASRTHTLAPAVAHARRRLRAFAQRHRPTGLPLDDSRESIYD